VNLWHLYNLYTRAKLVSPIICVGQFNHQNQLGNRCKPNSLSGALPQTTLFLLVGDYVFSFFKVVAYSAHRERTN
jgi:hypothetical protein